MFIICFAQGYNIIALKGPYLGNFNVQLLLIKFKTHHSSLWAILGIITLWCFSICIFKTYVISYYIAILLLISLVAFVKITVAVPLVRSVRLQRKYGQESQWIVLCCYFNYKMRPYQINFMTACERKIYFRIEKFL